METVCMWLAATSAGSYSVIIVDSWVGVRASNVKINRTA